jgi:hypothetical protein
MTAGRANNSEVRAAPEQRRPLLSDQKKPSFFGL